MIRKIITEDMVLEKKCLDIDVTIENGKYHSCTGLNEGLVRDMVDTLIENEDLDILAAVQIGYNSRALVLRQQKGIVPLLNPVLVKTSGGRQKIGDYMVYQRAKVSFWSVDGRQYQVKLTGNNAKAVQVGLKRIDN